MNKIRLLREKGHLVAGLIACVIVCTSMFLSAYFIYLYYFDANPPIVFDQDPIPIKNPLVKAGDFIITNPSGCRYTDVPVTIYYSIVDGFEYTMPSITYAGSSKKGECFDMSVVKGYLIPEDLPEGEYYISGKLEYKVNPIVTRYVNFRTEKFMVYR